MCLEWLHALQPWGLLLMRESEGSLRVQSSSVLHAEGDQQSFSLFHELDLHPKSGIRFSQLIMCNDHWAIYLLSELVALKTTHGKSSRAVMMCVCMSMSVVGMEMCSRSPFENLLFSCKESSELTASSSSTVRIYFSLESSPCPPKKALD